MGVTAAIIATAAGSAFSGISQMTAGGAQKKVADYNAANVENTTKLNSTIMDFNASLEDMQAVDAVKRGSQAETVHRKNVRTLIGAQRASYAGQNVLVDDGSALDVQADTAAVGEADALTIRANAAREAWGYKKQASNYRLQAESIRRTGKADADSLRLSGKLARNAGMMNGVGTIVGGAADVLSSVYGFKAAAGE